MNSESLALKHRSKGFTLLEVLIAMTITGLALGTLLGVIGGNKRLAWTSEAALLEINRVRAQINASQLDDGLGEFEIELDDADGELDLQVDYELEKPSRKTRALAPALRGYQISNADEVMVSGSYWLVLALPE